MTRCSALAAAALAAAITLTGAAAAQTGDGSLRGYVRDAQGGVLPGVTITATSPALIAPVEAVTDGTGYYRLLNLVPGTYTLTASLPGFSSFRRQGIELRAGANFAVDIVMRLAQLEETITVSGDSPMLEVSKPGNVLNVDGEFQKQMPLQARRNWSDFLELTPGVNARPFDDGSGRMVYFGHATEHFAHVIQLEGMAASSYRDSQVTYVGMGADMIDDIQVKTGGVDAASPLGTGLVINVVTKSGGNRFSGSGGWAFQPLDWNGDNAPTSGNFSGTPTIQKINQIDGSFGGPILRDKAWFFGSVRYADLESGISRTAREIGILESFSGMTLGGGRGTVPSFTPFNNTTESFQPYFKVSARLSPNHEVAGYYQRDTLDNSSNREYHFAPIEFVTTGGDLFGAKLTSIWGSHVTTTLTANYNNKTADTNFDLSPTSGPLIEIHEGWTESRGELSGTGRLAEGGGIGTGTRRPASVTMLRGDLTYYKEGWGGSHEFQTGFFLAPRNRYDAFTTYTNFDGDGWFFEEHALRDPANPQAGTYVFHRQRRDVGATQTIGARDRDLGLYLQDSWKPSPRLTLSPGIRVDFVRRHDQIFDFDRMNTTVVGPRFGFSYLVTDDGRNVLRGSAGRVHEAVMGRDNVTSYTGSAGGSGGRSTRIDQYDRNGDGVFETEVIRPASSLGLDPSIEFDPDLTQPYVDEYILGFRKQFAGQLAVDVAGIHRRYTKTYALTDINGIYPEEPFKPFIGFGRVDPNRGIIFQQTNNTWSKLAYSALEVTATQRLGRNFQMMASLNRQWQHMAGTWNPTDPARFIQPDHFDNNRALYMPRGNNEQNSLANSNNLSYAPTWREYSVRLGGSWIAPWDISVAASYTQNAGPWTGPLIARLSSSDPQVTQYGPSSIVLANGSRQGNPLATVYRFPGRDRGDGQVQAPAIRALGLKVGKILRLGGSREVEVAANTFNLFNWANFHQYTYSAANRTFSPNFLQMRSLQSARALQLTTVFRF